MPKTAPSLDQMRIELDAIGHVLSDKELAVPIYQRSYAWSDNHISDLFRDLSDAFQKNEDEYFLGSLVATNSRTGRYEIVDGQQRLATTTVLIAAIRDHLYQIGEQNRAADVERDFLSVTNRRTQDRVAKLQLNNVDHDYFQKAILSNPDSPDRKIAATKASHARLETARTLATKHVRQIAESTKKPVDVLFDYLDFIETKAKVIWVSVPDQANAFTVFETLNDRGLKLAISDLLKNFLFLTAEDRIGEVQNNWVSMLATLESVGGEEIVVTFIRHYWSSRHGATRERELYGEIKKKTKTKQAAVTLAKELAEGAKLYAAMLNPDHELWKTYGATARGHMSTLNLLQMIQIRPLLLAVLSEFSTTEARKALRLMVSWATRFLITGGLGGGTMETHYSERATEIRKARISTAKGLSAAMVDVVPTDKQFESAFENAAVSKPALARYYLAVLERHSRGETNPELVPNTNQEEVNLEHVLPQNPSTDWNYIPKDVAKAFYNRIGNLALMQADSNSVVGSSGFVLKKTAYAKSAFGLTSQIAKQKKWDVPQIEARQRALAKLAVEAWPLKA